MGRGSWFCSWRRALCPKTEDSGKKQNFRVHLANIGAVVRYYNCHDDNKLMNIIVNIVMERLKMGVCDFSHLEAVSQKR